MVAHAVRLPRLFFFPTSVTVSPVPSSVFVPPRVWPGRSGVLGRWHTGRKTLLKLLGLVGILQGKSVEVFCASNLELDEVGLLVLLDARRYHSSVLAPGEYLRASRSIALVILQEAS